MRQFFIGGIPFHDGVPHAGFEGYYLTKVTGWHDAPDVRRTTEERQTGDGSFDEAGYLTDRPLAFEGLIVANSVVKYEHLRKRLTSMFADRRMVEISEAVEGEQWFANGRLAGQVKVPVAKSGDMHSVFQMPFWCPDPLIYGDAFSFGPAPAVNVEQESGLYPAWPRVTVTATSSMTEGYGVNLHQTSDGPVLASIRVQAPLNAGSTHVIDMTTGTVSSGGVPILGGIQSGARWAIPPHGVYFVHLAPNSGAGVITVSGRNTRV